MKRWTNSRSRSRESIQYTALVHRISLCPRLPSLYSDFLRGSLCYHVSVCSVFSVAHCARQCKPRRGVVDIGVGVVCVWFAVWLKLLRLVYFFFQMSRLSHKMIERDDRSCVTDGSESMPFPFFVCLQREVLGALVKGVNGGGSMCKQRTPLACGEPQPGSINHSERLCVVVHLGNYLKIIYTRNVCQSNNVGPHIQTQRECGCKMVHWFQHDCNWLTK